MKSGDIRMLLSESTGIQTQQTSATSANASIRIQGLDGRYTQILKDGFPLFQCSKRAWSFTNSST
jgi:iron complex outermembrane receptor protein